MTGSIQASNVLSVVNSEMTPAAVPRFPDAITSRIMTPGREVNVKPEAMRTHMNVTRLVEPLLPDKPPDTARTDVSAFGTI